MVFLAANEFLNCFISRGAPRAFAQGPQRPSYATGRGHADDAVSLLITVVRGRRRPLSRPNYRHRSGNYRRLRSSALYASSAFFIVTG